MIGLKISGTCPGTFDNSTSTYITSPNHPQNYDNNVDCHWLITIPEEKSLVLYFTYFMTNGYNDKLTIYEGENGDGKQLYQYYGSNPEGITGISEKWVNAKSVYITFNSDSFGTGKGFKIMLLTFGNLIKLRAYSFIS